MRLKVTSTRSQELTKDNTYGYKNTVKHPRRSVTDSLLEVSDLSFFLQTYHPKTEDRVNGGLLVGRNENVR